MQPFLFSESIASIGRKIPKHVKITFFATFLIGLLVHLFMFTNKLPNHDDLGQLFDTMNRPASGRWFLFVPASFSSTISMPWVGGLLTLLYISLSACFIVSCLHIRKTVHCILVGAVLVSFPTVASTLPYMQSTDGYFFSLLLASLAAFLACRYRFGFLFAAPLVTLSLGIYQSYFPVTCTLLLLCLILEILEDRLPFQQILIKGLKYLCCLGVGMALYFLVVRLLPVQLTVYKGIDTMGQISLSAIPGLVKNAYLKFYHFFFQNMASFHFTLFTYAFLLVFLLLGCLMLYTVVAKKLYKKPLTLALLVLLLLLLPLSSALIYIMVATSSAHALMIYGFCIIIVSFPAIIEATSLPFPTSGAVAGKVLLSVSSWVVALVMVASVCVYSLKSNQAYFELYLAYEQSYSYATSLVTRIESAAAIEEEDTVVFIGNPVAPPRTVPASTIRLTGFPSSLVGVRNFTSLLRRYVGFTPTVVRMTEKEMEAQGLSAVVDAMAVYPAPDSIQKTGDMILVKFEDW